MLALLRPTMNEYRFTGMEGQDFLKRIGNVLLELAILEGNSTGSRSSTQLFRYAGIS